MRYALLALLLFACEAEEVHTEPLDVGPADAEPVAPDAELVVAADAQVGDAVVESLDGALMVDVGLDAEADVGDLDASPTDASLDSAVEVGVRYLLGWDTEGAERREGSWHIETDLGYSVRLDVGYLVSHAATLVPCPQASLLDLIIGTAHAGHGDESDPVEVYTPRVEDLLAAETVELGERPRSGALYCRIHYLVALGIEGETENLPAEPDMIDRSLYLRGEWVRGEESGPIEVDTGLAYGGFKAIADEAGAPFELDTSEAGAIIELRRPLARLFDGLELAELEGDTGDRAVLRNLLVGTSAVTRVEP